MRFFLTKTIMVLCLMALTNCVSTSVPNPVGATPTPRQLRWNEMEYYAFIHFNMNTFTDMEWGMGNEKPKWFNPKELNTDQWAEVVKNAGMKGIIITAKHHDGFCLWPSKYTEHSVKNSPWKNGNGDLLKDLSESCHKYNLKFGVYLSPWDRHHAQYGEEAYVEYFHNQLRELLTNYGDVFEVWFDGANGGTGYYGGANEKRTIDSRTYYQWEKVTDIVRELQPNAVIFGDGGPDVRWIGNEYGYGTPTNWSTFDNSQVWAGHSKKEHLQNGDEDGPFWIPAEADVSIRPGWYYHPREDHLVRSLTEMVDIYYNSVGRNATLLLNLPVDTRGLVHENDIIRLMELKDVIEADFANNLLKNTKIIASQYRGRKSKYKPDNVTDGNPQTYWTTNDGNNTASIEFLFEKPTTFNRFLVQEHIALGQRVKSFSIEYDNNGIWETIDQQTTIGYKRILRFEPITTTRFRFSILDSKDIPVISEMGVFNAPNLMVSPVFQRSKDGMITLSVPEKTTEIYYTIDNSEPNSNSLRYTKPFYLPAKTILKTISYDPVREKYSNRSQHRIDVDKSLWKIIEVSSGDFSKAEAVIDENPSTWWATTKNGASQHITVDMGQILSVSGFTYLPMQERWAFGTIKNYTFEVSKNGTDWINVSDNEFGNIKNNPIEQIVQFSPIKARYFRLSSSATVDNSSAVSFAEIGIITID